MAEPPPDPTQPDTAPPDRGPGLRVAAAAFGVIALAGPAMLAAGADPRPFAPAVAALWLAVFGGVAHWLRAWRRSRAAGGGRQRDRFGVPDRAAAAERPR
jgi:hypothetical protein